MLLTVAVYEFSQARGKDDSTAVCYLTSCSRKHTSGHFASWCRYTSTWQRLAVLLFVCLCERAVTHSKGFPVTETVEALTLNLGGSAHRPPGPVQTCRTGMRRHFSADLTFRRSFCLQDLQRAEWQSLIPIFCLRLYRSALNVTLGIATLV